jgi:hypothetical protein
VTFMGSQGNQKIYSVKNEGAQARYQLLFSLNVPESYILGEECSSAGHVLSFVP